MLKEIYVKNFVLIDEEHITFKNHLCAFTGETGAGKSLLIDAISLLIGARSNASYVKKGAKKAIIEGVFELDKDHPAYCKLQEAGYEESEIIITREINDDGKSSVRLNHRVISLAYLKELMGSILDIHSQHDSQYLLNPKHHLFLLDGLGNYQLLQEEVKAAYQKLQSISKEISRFSHEEGMDTDYLRYQLQELENSGLSLNEEAELLEEQKRLNSFEKMNLHTQNALDALKNTYGDLFEAKEQLSALTEFEEFKKLYENIIDMYYGLEGNIDDLQQIARHLDFDERRLEEINERLYELGKLKRKYHKSIKELIEFQEELKQRLYQFEHQQDALDALNRNKEEALLDFQKLAQQLHSRRYEQAEQLRVRIMKQCEDLCLPHFKFKVHFKEAKMSIHGLDDIEFYISMNPGEDLKPLAQVASGGELSRIMLGMKTIFNDCQHIETLIFDEIDTGVSGKVAFAIGRKMQQIAKNAQVFCVTHLSAVAACAQTQYLVEKVQKENSTQTKIIELDEEQRIRVLALISSNSDSPSALRAAKELLAQALS